MYITWSLDHPTREREHLMNTKPVVSRQRKGKGLIGFILVVALIVASGVAIYVNYIGQTTKVVTVCNTMKIPSTKNSTGVTGNIVATSDGIYNYNDYLLVGVGARFDSLDGFTKMRVGGVYEVTSYGWRIGFLSQVPNIISAIPSDQQPIGSC